MKTDNVGRFARSRRRAGVVFSPFLSLQRHLLFFVIVCFSICCSNAPSHTNSVLCGCCVAASVVPPDQPDELIQQQEQEQPTEDDATTENTEVKRDRDRKLEASTKTDNVTNLTLNQILIRAGKRGLGGGISGALAGIVQVLALMWLRTITNYQCRYGTSFKQSLMTLMKEGGIRRLYRGLTFALLQAPVTRFVSTAANDGVETFLASFSATKFWGPERTTVIAALVVGFARILLMPIDTMKTVLQVDSTEGFRGLMRRLKMGKFMVLYEGSLAVAVMGVVGHYPWFVTYNVLTSKEWLKNSIPNITSRNALIGFVASIISDSVTNVFRVVKTTKQATGSKNNSSYIEIIRMILAADGWKGLFGRGLATRLASNALQSVLFTVVWRSLADWMKSRNEEKPEKETK